MRKLIRLNGVGLLFLSILLSGCTEKPTFQGEYEWELQDFRAITQDGKSVGKEDYIGEAWVANFIFTNCSTVCLPMTANMATLQQKLTEADVNFKMVSFSVDPERDTEKVLKEYGEKYEADYDTWSFLTGYTQEDVQAIAKNFKTLAQKEEGTDQITHGTKIFLINREGMIVKGYNGLDVPYDEIISDLKVLNN